MPRKPGDVCGNGHKMTDANTYHFIDTGNTPRRQCRACKKIAYARRQGGHAVRRKSEQDLQREESARTARLQWLEDQIENHALAYEKPALRAEMEALRG